MSKTSTLRGNGVRDSTEQEVKDNYAAEYAKRLFDKERREREDADKSLSTAIENEATDRENADKALSDAIEQEAKEREDADKSLADDIAENKKAIKNESEAREQTDNMLRSDIDGLNESVFGKKEKYTATLTYHYDSALYSFATDRVNIPVDTTFNGFILTLADGDGVLQSLDSTDMPDGWFVDWSHMLANTETARSVYLYFDAIQKRIWFGNVNGTDKNGFRIGVCGGEPGDYWLEFLPPAGENVERTVTPSLEELATDDKSSVLAAVNELANKKITVDEELSDTSENPVQNKVIKTALDALKESSTFATKKEIRDAWNSPVPTPTVTLEGVYDDANSALIVTSTELAKLAAIDEGETFDLVIHASGVEYSGAAKNVSYIGLNSNQEPPGYVTAHSGFPLWDGEYDFNTFLGCVMVSQYDNIDNGEISGGSW